MVLGAAEIVASAAYAYSSKGAAIPGWQANVAFSSRPRRARVRPCAIATT